MYKYPWKILPLLWIFHCVCVKKKPTITLFIKYTMKNKLSESHQPPVSNPVLTCVFPGQKWRHHSRETAQMFWRFGCRRNSIWTSSRLPAGVSTSWSKQTGEKLSRYVGGGTKLPQMFSFCVCSCDVLMWSASTRVPSHLWRGAPTGWSCSLETIRDGWFSHRWTWTRWAHRTRAGSPMGWEEGQKDLTAGGVVVFTSRVCVTPSCCWRRCQVWFRWSTATSCCWCPRSNDHCCTALRKRRSSSWVPNLARGKRPPIMSSTTALTLHSHQCPSKRRLN